MEEAAPFDLFELLDRPLLVASVAAIGGSAGPALGSLWFSFDQRRFWFSTRDGSGAFLEAARASKLAAVLVQVFEPPTNIRRIRVTGPAQIEKHDPGRVQKIYERYLGADLDEWPAFFRERLHDETFRLWSVYASTGKAEDYPDFGDHVFRWNEPGDFLDRR